MEVFKANPCMVNYYDVILDLHIAAESLRIFQNQMEVIIEIGCK
jgi:hypothetical protein